MKTPYLNHAIKWLEHFNKLPKEKKEQLKEYKAIKQALLSREETTLALIALEFMIDCGGDSKSTKELKEKLKRMLNK